MKITIQQNALKAIALFISSDDCRYILNGVLIDATIPRPLLVATDGRFMAVLQHGSIEQVNGSPAIGQIVLNRKGIEAALSLCARGLIEEITIEAEDKSETVKLIVGKDSAVVHGGASLGGFPNYHPVLPQVGTALVDNPWVCFDPERFQKFADAGGLLGSGTPYLITSFFGESKSEHGHVIGVQLSNVPEFFGLLMSVRRDAPAPTIPTWIHQ
jgi:hypothetical protein